MPAARNVIDGILRMSAQTFLNSLATNIQKLLMYVTLALKSEPVFWNIISTMQRKLTVYTNKHFQSPAKEST